MAKKRLNDTSAIAEDGPRPLAPFNEESLHVRTRKIDNGYVTYRSESKDGDYECKETFSKTPPKEHSGNGSKPNPMKAAVDHLNK